jgi:hypothetical protein
MQITNISCPVVQGHFDAHTSIKKSLLDAINKAPGDRLVGHADDISKCDWETGRFDYDREWVKILRNDLIEYLNKWINLIEYNNFDIGEIWFQQYTTGGKHSWHTHSANFTNVYYLDLPGDSPKTEWIDPMTKEHKTFDVKEGDIITFPSWVKHRSSKNNSTSTKTIISWNTDVAISDRYGEENGYN